MSDSLPLRRRSSDHDDAPTRVRSDAGRDIGDTRHALREVGDAARVAGTLVLEVERDLVTLRRIADGEVRIVVPEPALQSPPRRWRWIGVGLLAVVLLSTWGLTATNRNQVLLTDAPGIDGAAFTGTIKPRRQNTVTASAAGTVRRVFVDVGDTVTAGQALLEIDDPNASEKIEVARVEQQSAAAEVAHWQQSIDVVDKSIAEASSAFAATMGALAVAQRQAEQVPGRQLRDSPERAQAAYDQERSKLQRLQRLHASQLISDQALEEQVTAVRIAQNDLDNARQWQTAALELQRLQQEHARQQVARSRSEAHQLRADYVARLAQARARLARVDQQLAAARGALSAALVRATTDGVVVAINVVTGNHAPADSPLLQIARLDQLIVEVPVSSTLVNVLRPGQEATVILPTIPAERTDGRIVSISPLPAANMTHTIEIEFANGEGRLLTGQPAQVVFR